jgi:NAD(P)-dependent dehydrogenase (short-subunit alcohol dehydrogenase family)
MAQHRPVALVTGANRGLGLELVRSYARDGWQVIGTCRDAHSATEPDPDVGVSLAELAARHDVIIDPLDLADRASIDALAERHRGTAIDLLINNAGTMGPMPLEEHIHRQRFGGVDYDLWADVLLANTLGTVRVTEAFVEHVASSDRKTVVTLSSTAGSIGESDRTAMAYTTSKTALNKAMTIAARSLAPREVIVAIVCPGHVKTRLGKGGAGVEIEDSVAGMRSLIDSFTLADSGTFRRYNGEHIAW